MFFRRKPHIPYVYTTVATHAIQLTFFSLNGVGEKNILHYFDLS